MGEEGALQAAYEDVRWRTRTFRAILAALERVYPMSGFVKFAGEVDRGIRTTGLAPTCTWAIDRLGLQCRFAISDATRDVLDKSPVIIYGNHPTLLTPFLIAAAVDRPDLRFFMLSYVGRLVPSLRRYMLPLELSRPRRWTEWRRGGTRRMISHWITETLEKERVQEAPKLSNRRRLAQGVDHLRQGGCVVIFPSGGGKGNQAWYPGIGVLAKTLLTGPEASDVYLVPMHEGKSSNRHVYASLKRVGDRAGPNVGQRLGPMTLHFGEPIRLGDLVHADESPAQTAARLHAHYDGLFPPPRGRLAWLRWLTPWRYAWNRR
jgi:1-acyl-sn-glycerol-3-phosphate acyltransferase